jgi:hypothetical protein
MPPHSVWFHPWCGDASHRPLDWSEPTSGDTLLSLEKGNAGIGVQRRTSFSLSPDTVNTNACQTTEQLIPGNRQSSITVFAMPDDALQSRPSAQAGIVGEKLRVLHAVRTSLPALSAADLLSGGAIKMVASLAGLLSVSWWVTWLLRDSGMGWWFRLPRGLRGNCEGR